VTLSVVDDVRRVFRRDELLLLSDLLARVWPLVERARTEARSRRSSKASKLAVERHQSDAQRRAADDLALRVTAESDRRHRLYETIFRAPRI